METNIFENQFSEFLGEKKEGEIMLFKLSSGEEVIAKVIQSSPMFYLIKKPLVLSLVQIPGSSGQAGVVFIPFMIGSDENSTIKIMNSAVVAVTKPTKEAENGYIKNTSGLEIPTPNIDLSSLRKKLS